MRLAAKRHILRNGGQAQAGLSAPYTRLVSAGNIIISSNPFLSPAAQRFFHTDMLLRFLDEHYKARWTTAARFGPSIFPLWYDVYFLDNGWIYEKPAILTRFPYNQNLYAPGKQIHFGKCCTLTAPVTPSITSVIPAPLYKSCAL